jgi:hypothetical protein
LRPSCFRHNCGPPPAVPLLQWLKSERRWASLSCQS